MLGGDQGVAGEEGHQGRGEGEGGGPVGGEQLQEHRGLEPGHRSHAGHGEQLQLPGQGDGEAALVQHAGHRHVQPEDVVQGQHAHRHLLLHMASDHYNPSELEEPQCWALLPADLLEHPEPGVEILRHLRRQVAVGQLHALRHARGAAAVGEEEHLVRTD